MKIGLAHNPKAGLLMHPEIHTPALGRIEGHEAKMLDRHPYFVKFPILQDVPVEAEENPGITEVTKGNVSDEDLRENPGITEVTKGNVSDENLRVSSRNKLTVLWAELKRIGKF